MSPICPNLKYTKWLNYPRIEKYIGNFLEILYIGKEFYIRTTYVFVYML